jgi:hypothetical protein
LNKTEKLKIKLFFEEESLHHFIEFSIENELLKIKNWIFNNKLVFMIPLA